MFLKNNELEQENKRPKNFIYDLFQRLKDIFKKILHIGTEKGKNDVVEEITYCYDKEFYDDTDLYYISTGTSKETEVLHHTESMNKEEDNYEISL